MTGLDDEDPVYTDAVIDGMIEDLGFDAAVAAVWIEKAASVAGMVDITESGSSRSFSKLRDAYLGMADAVKPEDETGAGSGTFVVGIERV